MFPICLPPLILIVPNQIRGAYGLHAAAHNVIAQKNKQTNATNPPRIKSTSPLRMERRVYASRLVMGHHSRLSEHHILKLIQFIIISIFVSRSLPPRRHPHNSRSTRPHRLPFTNAIRRNESIQLTVRCEIPPSILIRPASDHVGAFLFVGVYAIVRTFTLDSTRKVFASIKGSRPSVWLAPNQPIESI